MNLFLISSKSNRYLFFLALFKLTSEKNLNTDTYENINISLLKLLAFTLVFQLITIQIHKLIKI